MACRKPLPEPMITDHQWGLVALTAAISKEILKIRTSLKMTNLRLQPYLPGGGTHYILGNG